MTVFCKKTYFRVCFRHIAMPIAVVFFMLRAVPCTAQNLTDNELLGNAIEYFQSNKYHEALIIFEKLERSHKLNPRYIAYMGLCYYHEWSFQKACKYFEDALPQLNLFSPHERSVYQFTCAESYFALEEYEKAFPHYEEALNLCYDNEKGDIYFRLGYCCVNAEKWQEAYDYLTKSRQFYLSHRNTDGLKARMRQIDNMIIGCEAMLPKDAESTQSEPDVLPDVPKSVTPEVKNENASEPNVSMP